jgi:hypothetical protein
VSENRPQISHRRGQTENEAVQQNGRSTRGTFAGLAFANHVHVFIASDRAPSPPEGAEMLTGVDPPLDGAVVLFKDIAPGTAPVDVGSSHPERPRL